MKKSFTLAEIMIALTIIGIITAILLPVAQNSLPNEKVMKFKKANATLHKVINELVTSGEYYTPGDLGIKSDGTLLDGSHEGDCDYLCETMAQVVDFKEKNCKVECNIRPSTLGFSYEIEEDSPYCADEGYCMELIDDACKGSADIFGTEDGATYGFYPNAIILNDDTTFYTINMVTPFGASTVITGWDGSERFWTLKSSKGFIRVYKPLCIDIDGIGKGEDPFGYGVRVDGKIVLGTRAQEWLEKDIQDKE